MMKRWAHWLFAALVAGTLSACGGGGGGDDAGGGGPTAADLTLSLSAFSLVNTGAATISATVTAVDSNRNALAGIPVTVSVNSNAVAAVSGASTNTQGIVTAQIGIGADRSNRIVTVTARSGGLTRTATFSVTGAELSATPVPAVIAPGDDGEVQFRLVDASANGIGGVSIVVTGPGGVETSGTTGPSGEYTLDYTAPSSSPTGTLEFRANAGGADVTQLVQLDTGGGTIPVVTALVRSASVSANPDVVGVNDVGSTTNRSEVRAVFIGDSNAPIPNIRVRFDLAGDLNSVGGTFTSASSTVYANSNGVATTSYIPGTRSSPTNGVTIRACWDYDDFDAGTCPRQVTTTLTVNSEPQSITIGENAILAVGTSQLTYVKRFIVSVTDISGQAAAGVLVTPSIDLDRYYKGYWAVVGDAWVQFPEATCDNEDLNRNGVNEVYSDGTVEDANGSLNFTPGRPALEPRRADVTLVIEGSNRTDSNGQVVLRIEYPQSVASWVHYNLTVSASGIGGTEARANIAGDLPVLASEVNDVATNVPFELSPYGVEPSATELRVNPSNTSQRGILCLNPR
jgi:hypothetical protein